MHLTNLYRFLLLGLSMVCSTVLVGQIYPFVNYSVEEGISNSQILAVEQHDNGEMWFGTNDDGITVFDGLSFSYLTTNDSLANNVVFDIQKDSNGDMWIGTNDGLSLYKDNTFTNYRTEDGLTHNRIFNVTFDPNGKMMLATNMGVTTYENGQFKAFEEDTLLSKSIVVNINYDDHGNIFFCTLQNGLIHYDGKEFKQYKTSNTNDIITDYVYGVIPVTEGRYWVLTHHGIADWRGESMTRLDFPMLDDDEFTCYNFAKDHEGSIWVGTSNGVFKYRKDEWSRFSTVNGLGNDNIYKLMQDREGNMWFASRENGVSKLAAERFFVIDDRCGLEDNTVQRIHRSHDGTFWLGTTKGIAKYRGGEIVETIIPDKTLGGVKIWSITESQNGDVWYGTDNGIGIFENGVVRTVFETKILPQKYVYDILLDSKGQNWMATRGGIAQVDGDTIRDANHIFGTPEEPAFQLYEDDKGNIWIAAESGLYRYDGESTYHFSADDGFVSEKVRSITDDGNGNMWFATSSGIYRRNRDGIFSNFNERDGLSSNTIYSLIFDARGNLWAGVTNGIDQIVFKGNDVMKILEVRHFGPEDGFIGQVCNNNALAVGDNGNVYIGTIKGLMVYQPEFDRKNTKEPLTRLKNVRLFSLQTDWAEYTDSVTVGNIPTNLVLPYNKNYFAFDFVGVSHMAPEKVRYQYMLEGLDKGYLAVTDRTEAVYSNLPFGSYTFKVKADNGEGVWNTEEVTFSFVINPPFWRTWWFYSICFILFMLAVWSYLRIRNSNIKITQQNNEIIQQRDEIQRAKDEIQEKSDDIMASIKYAKRIQDAILPSDELVKSYLPESFVLYLPKDIVSGDFYWIQERDGKVLFAAVDCTGHGVPGAFVSIVGHNHLNEALKEAGFIKPGNILNYLNQAVTKTLHQRYEVTQVRDGMDLALCSIDRTNMLLQYAGANNPLYIVRNGELLETKATKRAIGSPYGAEQMPTFTNHEIEVQKDDAIYVFSDGLADQFGGPKGKKFKYKQFRDLLVSISSKPMEQQKELLHSALKDWMQDYEQIDDICVIGVRV